MNRYIWAIFLSSLSLAAFAQKDKQSSYNYQRGVEAVEKGNLDEGIEYLKKEISSDKNNGYAYGWLQSAYMNKKDYSSSLTMSDMALKHLPQKDKSFIGWVYNARADAFCYLGEREKALDNYNQSIKCCPDNAEYLAGRADLLYRMEKYDESNSDYEKISEIDTGSALGFAGLGRNCIRQEKLNEAVMYFTKALKLNPEQSQYFAFRAQAYLGLNDIHSCTDDIVKALDIDNNDKAYDMMTDLHGEGLNEILMKLSIKQTKEPADDRWSYYRGLVYENDKQYKNALECYKKGFAIDNTPFFYARMSNCYSELGAQEDALRMIDLAIASDSTSSEYHYDKADILYYMGKGKEAIGEMTVYIEAEPDWAGGYYRRGFYKDNMGDVDGAIEDYSYSIMLKPDFAYSYLGRADMYLRKGERDLANRDYEQVIKMDTIIGNNNCAHYAYYALGMKDKALEFTNRILEKNKNPGNWYDAACLSARMGDKEKALEYLRKCLDMGYNKLVHIHLDDDMNLIRQTPEFISMMKEYSERNKENLKAISDVHDSDYTEQLVEIPFQKEGDMLMVKCTINNLPLHFIFDTGCSDVSISQVEANFMMKNSYLTSKDVVGKTHFSDASGNISEGTVLNLKKVRFGELELNNVRASVVKNQKAPLLLGQSILGRLGKIEIDNSGHKLKVTRQIKSEKANKD